MAAQCITAEAILKGNVRKEFAWSVISDFSRFPALMKSVDKVSVLESGGDRGVSEWFMTVDNAPFRWIEKDEFDRKNYEIRFESIDGDFESIRGSWKVEDYNNEGIKLRFCIKYTLGIPVIEDVVGAVLKEKMEKNMGHMLEAVSRELEKSRSEGRKHERYPIKAYATITINDREFRTNVANISRGGMMFSSGTAVATSEAKVSIDNVVIKAELHWNEPSRTVARAIFRDEISESNLERALRWLMTKNARFHERKSVEKDVVLESENKSVSVHLVNISRSGMLISYANYYEEIDGKFNVCGIPAILRVVNHDSVGRTISVQFSEPLGDLDFAAILTILEHTHEEREELQVA
jgi:ribosome-associated toxin RatA of RatAB toxin-antitoxin module